MHNLKVLDSRTCTTDLDILVMILGGGGEEEEEEEDVKEGEDVDRLSEEEVSMLVCVIQSSFTQMYLIESC
jgi:hypothetical protein